MIFPRNSLPIVLRTPRRRDHTIDDVFYGKNYDSLTPAERCFVLHIMMEHRLSKDPAVREWMGRRRGVGRSVRRGKPRARTVKAEKREGDEGEEGEGEEEEGYGEEEEVHEEEA